MPVSTRSTTASARPKPQAASTDPETYLILVCFSGVSYLLKKSLVKLGNEVTILFPASWEGSLILEIDGAWRHNLQEPNPRF